MKMSTSKFLDKIQNFLPTVDVSEIESLKEEFNTTYQKIYQLLVIGVSIDDVEHIFKTNRETEFPPSILSLAKLYNAVGKDIYAFLESVDIFEEYRGLIESILLSDESMHSDLLDDYTEKFKQSTRICNKLIQLLVMNYSSPSLLRIYLENRHSVYNDRSVDDEDLSLTPIYKDYGYDDEE